VLISGGTGSGKTTLLNAMSQLIDPGERIVTIEDAAELQLQQPHVVRLESRPPNLEGGGEVTIRDLLRNALRMRPDRIIIGEVRGAEALALLKAWNTGHPGGVTTIHANSAKAALTRLSSLVQEAGVPPQPELIAETINLLAFIVRTPGGRRVKELVRVDGYSATDGFILTSPNSSRVKTQGNNVLKSAN
jgi:pilus assembly protein CpaF